MLDTFKKFGSSCSKIQNLFRKKKKLDFDIFETDIKSRFTFTISNLKENSGLKALTKKSTNKKGSKKSDKKNAAKKDLKKKLGEMTQE